MEKLNKKEIQEAYRLQSFFPSEVSVSIKRSEDGGFVAEITTFPGCFTQADSFSELIENVNDAVLTYFEIPEKYLKLMPSYCPPTELACSCGVYPANMGMTETLKLFINCEAH